MENLIFLAWLNRIGMLISLITGLLIIPEVIGSQRLQNWEVVLKNFLHKIKHTTDIETHFRRVAIEFENYEKTKSQSTISPESDVSKKKREKREKIKEWLHDLSVLGLWLVLIIVVKFRFPEWNLTAVAIGTVFVADLIYFYVRVPLPYFIKKQSDNRKTFFEKLAKVHYYFFRAIPLLLVIPVFFLLSRILGIIFNIVFYVLFYVILIVMSLLFRISSITIKVLQGRNRFRIIYIRSCIALFILGNLFMFVATFGK